MHGFSYPSGQIVRYSRSLLIGIGISIVATLISACGNEESRSHVPAEAMQCIEYTKKSIEARGENYSRYTDRALEDGESVWVAGRRFNFDYVRGEPGIHNPTFITPDAWGINGKFFPGITLTYRDSVAHMKETMPGVILSDIDPGGPNIIIKIDCEMGVTPSTEKYLPFDSLAKKMIGGPSGYVISLNDELGFYQALGGEKHAYDYFYMHHDGVVDMEFPSIFCDQEISTGICFAKVTAWNNIVLRYRFPRRQLGDFTRIYQVTKGKIDAALAKGER